MLRLDKDGAIARLLIDRPERHTAMNLAMWQALPDLYLAPCPWLLASMSRSAHKQIPSAQI